VTSSASVFVFTFYNPRADETAAYTEWLRDVHIPENLDLLDGVVAGHLFSRQDQQPVMTDPLAFPLFSIHEFTDDPERILDEAHSIERQAYEGGRAYTRTTLHSPLGDRHGSSAPGESVVVEFAQYPPDLRPTILEYQRAQWLDEVCGLDGVIAVQRYEKYGLDHPPIPFSAPLSYRDLIIWEFEDGVGRWLGARSDTGLDAGFPEFTDDDLARASLSERRSGAFVRLL